ncbi:MAG: cytidine/deoxycytidylate deaminase family protein [Bacillota bacterium]|nr:cytidine/deoxycytidylate deaminase family protein [Bacillota bacterium]HHU61554.1 cytidine deaminase [Natronincola sp.]
MVTPRPSWEQYFMDIAHLVSSRSTCVRRRVGAVLVRDKHIIATGYNGAPRGVAHCLDVGCLRDKMQIPSGERHEMCRGTHAEQNAIIQAALHGVSTNDATLYCTHQPCILCAKMLINAGIKTVVFRGEYPDGLALELMNEAGLIIKQWDEEE